MKIINQDNKKIISTDVLYIVLFVVITVMLFSPFVVYVTNASELWFKLSDFMPMLCLWSLGAVVFLFVVLGVLPKKITSFVSVVLFALGVGTYIQGQILKNDYGTLNGQEIEWNARSETAVLSIIVWLACVLGAIAIYLVFNVKALNVIKWFSVALIAYEMLMSAMLIFQYRDNIFRSEDEFALTNKGLLDVSAENNVIVLVLDAYGGSTFLEVEENYPEVDEIFDGFRFYPDTTCVAAETKYAVPYLLTGKVFTQPVTYKEYLKQSYSDSKLLKKFRKGNVNAGVYAYSGFTYFSESDNLINFAQEKIKPSSYTGLSKDMLKLSMFRATPYFLKKYFWMYSGDFDKYKVSSGSDAFNAGGYGFDADNVGFYNVLKDNGLSIVEDNSVFRYIHLFGNHTPYKEDETGLDGETDKIRQARGCMVYVDEYFKQLKELGVYDNSYIIVTADHGSNGNGDLSLQCNPVLLVKPTNSRGVLERVDTPIYLSCFEDMLLNALDGSIEFPEKWNEVLNKRPFFKGDGRFPGVEEYYIDGKAYEAPTVVATGRLYNGNLLDENAKYPKYELGDLLEFRYENESVAKYVTQGMLFVDKDFTMLTSDKTVFRFDIKNKFDYVRAYVRCYLNNNGKKVRILANGNVVYDDYYDAGEFQIDIPKEYFPDGKLELIIEHENSGLALVYIHINPLIEY